MDHFDITQGEKYSRAETSKKTLVLYLGEEIFAGLMGFYVMSLRSSEPLPFSRPEKLRKIKHQKLSRQEF